MNNWDTNKWNSIYQRELKKLDALRQIRDLEREIRYATDCIDMLTKHCTQLLMKQEKIKDEFGLQSWGETTDNKGQVGINACNHTCGAQDESTAQ